MNLSTIIRAKRLKRRAAPFDAARLLNRDHLTSALSITVLLALVGWLTAQSVPEILPKPQNDAARDVPSEVYSQRAPKHVVRPAVAAIHLPPPPRLSAQSIAITLPATKLTAPLQPGRADLALSVRALRPSPRKVTATPAITPLAPTEAQNSKPFAASTIVQPPAPKARPESPEESVRKLKLAERLSTQMAVRRTPEPLVAPAPSKSQRMNNKPELHAAAVAPLSNSQTQDNQAKPWPENSITLDRKLLHEGRVLLRVLEQGAGPSIEIAWPEGAAARERLFERFVECFGMRVALMDYDGKLFTDAGQSGQPWAINLDRFSGFARQPTGHLVAEEKHTGRRIRTRHTGLRDAFPVRVFPRRVDAQLLAGLKSIAGQAYVKDGVMQARYRLSSKTVTVEDIRINGRTAQGQVDLSPTIRSCMGKV